MVASGDSSFYFEGMENGGIGGIRKSVFKFNTDLKPIWKEPIVSKEIRLTMNTLSYKNPVDQTITDYLIGIGNKTIRQILPNGTVKEQDTKIPKKELDKAAALFTDARGLNLLTIVGDAASSTETMDWYTFSHDNLSQTKRTIRLPEPSGVVIDGLSGLRLNEVAASGWRLNEVAASGLYFYYVSYKIDPKEKGNSTLFCHVIHVDSEGKAGNIINLDFGLSRSAVVPLDYQQDAYPSLSVFSPPLYELRDNGGGRSASAYPNKNAHVGIKIDENAKRIYTVVALDDDIKFDNEARKRAVLGLPQMLRSMKFMIYDLEGKSIGQSPITKQIPNLIPTITYGQFAGYTSEFIPLPDNEGVVCKLFNGTAGYLWTINTNGEITQEAKPNSVMYKMFGTKRYIYTFSATYFSQKDFANSPYALKNSSPIYQFFQKLDDNVKTTTHYLSLKNTEILGVWDSNGNKVTFYSFNKNAKTTD